MQIHGNTQIQQAHGLQGPHFNRAPQKLGAPQPQPTDQLDISPAAQAAMEGHEVNGVRTDLVARLRNEIDSGSYETGAKLEQAVERLFDSLG